MSCLRTFIKKNIKGYHSLKVEWKMPSCFSYGEVIVADYRIIILKSFFTKRWYLAAFSSWPTYFLSAWWKPHTQLWEMYTDSFYSLRLPYFLRLNVASIAWHSPFDVSISQEWISMKSSQTHTRSIFEHTILLLTVMIQLFIIPVNSHAVRFPSITFQIALDIIQRPDPIGQPKHLFILSCFL